jgi:Anti-anti-sigma regulatory factor (antagonist of anti-sigma factor)
MTLGISIGDGISRVTLPVRLDGSNAGLAESELAPVLEAGLPVVVDASPCEYISSAGLRLLLVVAKRLTPRGASVSIAAMGDALTDIMRMTGFDHMFAFYPGVDEAVKAAKPGA